MVALPSFLIGAFAPTIKDELDFGDTELGALFTAGYLVSAMALQLAGGVADTRGPTGTLRAGVGLAGVAALALSLTGGSYAILLVLFLAMRVAESTVHPATNTLVSEAVPARQQGRSLGIKQSAIPFSTLLAGLAVPLLGDSIGWKGTFAIVGVLAVPVIVTAPNPPRPPSPTRPSSAALWRTRHLRLLGAAGALAAASVVTVAGFLTTAAEDAGFSEGEAGLLLSAGGAVMVVSRLTWGWLADRFAFDRFVAVAAALGVGSVAYVLFATESKPLLVAGTVLVFGVGWSWPGVVLLGIIEHHPEAPGAASAVIQTSVRLGALGSPLLFGLLADEWGFDVAWWLPFGFALAGAAMMLLGSAAARAAAAERTVPAVA